MNLYRLINGAITLDELLHYYNANITYVRLPKRIHGFVFQYWNINNIFINYNMSDYNKKLTMFHELAHIELNQLGQIDNDLLAFKVDKYEDEADKYVKFLLENK